MKPCDQQATFILFTRLGLREEKAPQRRGVAELWPQETPVHGWPLPPALCVLQTLRTGLRTVCVRQVVLVMLGEGSLGTVRFPRIQVCPTALWNEGPSVPRPRADTPSPPQSVWLR